MFRPGKHPNEAPKDILARAVLSSFVGNTLVCIDDFERKSPSVTVNEIMGTIAQLRDARKCKVVVIINEDSLDKTQREEFQRFSEKVFNRSMHSFLPRRKQLPSCSRMMILSAKYFVKDARNLE
jgi:hypothetical protein